MLGILLQPPRVCKAYTPPPSRHPFVGPHTESLSWHHSQACCQMSSPCASAGPTQRCLCPCPACRSIYPGKDVGVHTSLIILLKKGIYVEAPERVCHLCPWISQLKDRHIQLRGCQAFPLPAPSVPMPMAHSFTRSGVSIRVWCSPVWGGRRRIPSANCSALGLRWPSVRSHCPSMGGESCLGPLPHPRGSSILLRCTPHQLARGVRLPCRSNWCIMGRVLGPTSEPSAVGGSNGPLPHLHQGEEANVEVGRVRDPLEKASSTWVWTASVASCSKPRQPCLS